MVLSRNPDKALSPSDLAQKVGVKRPTMTGLLDGLEKDKLIQRLPYSDDRRKLLILITKKGQERLSLILPGYYALISELMSKLNRIEQESLVSLLAKAFPWVC